MAKALTQRGFPAIGAGTTLRPDPMAFADRAANMALKLQHAIETAGIDFIEEIGGGTGVRLRKRSKSK
jgi:hypothetical protein